MDVMLIRPLRTLVPALSAVMLIGLSSTAQAGMAPSAVLAPSAQTVQAAATATSISFVASASRSANTKAPAVTVPASTQVGDTLILTASLGNATAASATSGWALKGDQNATAALRSLVWTRTATASDAGSSVAVTMETIHKSALAVSVYRGVDAAKAVTATANTDSNGTRHTTPAVNVAPDSRVISYWSERGAATTKWTTTPSVMRASGYSAGGGRVSAAVGDANAASSGAVAGSTATTDGASTVGVNWSIVLQPPTPEPGTVFGMNVSPGTSFTNGSPETAAQQVSRITNTYGSLPVAKIFYPGALPTTFNLNYEGLVPGKVVAVCFKPNQTSLANGSLDASIKKYIDSIPAGWKVMLVNWQEPDDEMWKDNVFTMEQHRAATERLIDVARANPAYAADRVEVWDVYMGYSLDVGRWKDAAASPRLDGIGWDYYWNKPTTSWSTDPAVALKKMADTNKRIGIKDYGLFETGDNPHPNDTDGSGRAGFWTKVFNSSQALGYDYVIYFNAIGTTGDHRILPGTAFGDPPLAVLRTLMTRQ